MSSRRLRSAVLLASIALALTGCFVPAEPADPTPTPLFATEEEAFAAAEATYRAYLNAVNAHQDGHASDPAPEDFLVGSALESALASGQQLEADGLRIDGITKITAIVQRDPADGVLTVGVCLNTAGTRIIDASGTDVTPAERPTLVPIEVGFVEGSDQLLITSSIVGDPETCSATF